MSDLAEEFTQSIVDGLRTAPARIKRQRECRDVIAALRTWINTDLDRIEAGNDPTIHAQSIRSHLRCLVDEHASSPRCLEVITCTNGTAKLQDSEHGSSSRRALLQSERTLSPAEDERHFAAWSREMSISSTVYRSRAMSNLLPASPKGATKNSVRRFLVGLRPSDRRSVTSHPTSAGLLGSTATSASQRISTRL